MFDMSAMLSVIAFKHEEFGIDCATGGSDPIDNQKPARRRRPGVTCERHHRVSMACLVDEILDGWLTQRASDE
jgi:hypothetical protein